MIQFAAVSISASGMERWVAAGAVLGVAAVAFSYWSARLDNQWRGLAASLKVAGILLLLIALLEPVIVDSRPRLQSNYFVIAADNSAGLGVRDPGESATRGEALQDWLTQPEQPLLSRSAELFKLRKYVFDGRLSPVQDFGELDFTGTSSLLHSSLEQIGHRFDGRPLAGILLFTDGIATDAIPASGLPENLPPVFPVVLGEPEALRDISVDNVTISESAFEDAPVQLTANVTANGFVGEGIELRVVDEAGAVLARETQTSVTDGESMLYRFQIRPEEFGVTWFAVVARSSSLEEGEDGADEEATLENNQKIAVLKRRAEPFRVLYLSGRPNWEYKFLNRALEEDDQVDLVGLIRVANKMPKFTFKGRRGETSNPLYRGFDGQDELTEQFDEAVVKRLNVRDGELEGGFPRLAEELFDYHALIIAKIEAAFFTRDQMNLIQKFVSERGGGLIVMGGLESFREGGYYRTPIGELLPVYIDRDIENVVGGDLRLELSREGWLAPWMRLRGTESEELVRLETTRGFQAINQVRDVKPGASVMASVVDDSGQRYPAVVTQRFGRGRVGALMVGDFWNWGLGDEKTQEDLSKFWRQIARWSVADVPDRVRIELLPEAGLSADRVRVRVTVVNGEFQPMDNAEVSLTATRVGSGEVDPGLEISLDPDSEPGVYSTLFTAVGAGVHVFKAEATGPDGRRVATDVTGWYSDLNGEEFRTLVPDLAALEDVARQTGGRVLRMNELESFVGELDSVEAPVVELHASPLWHNGWWMLAAVICLCGEWGVRRWKGVA